MKIVGATILLVGAFAFGAGIKLTQMIVTSPDDWLYAPLIPCIFDSIAFTIAGLIAVIAGIKTMK